MRTRTRTFHAAVFLLLVLGMVTLAAPSTAAGQDDCSDFDRKHTITKLGGPNALAPGGLQTLDQLQAYFAAHADEVRAALASRGHGDKVADALLAAIRDNAGIAERPMAKGEQLEWMAYRKRGELRTIDHVCLDLPEDQPAFEITVPVVTAVVAPPADCTLEVTTDCQPDGTSTFSVHTAPGATVTLAGPEGTRKVIDGGVPTWTGAMDDPYRADYTFTVDNASAVTETVTTYTFLVPRACGNLALVGQSESIRPGAPVPCTDQRSFTQPVCPAPAPTCTIELDAAEVDRDDLVAYRVSGTWSELDVTLMRDGAPLAEPALAGEAGTFSIAERGSYTVVGTATNELGQAYTCVAPLEVVGSEWFVRPFGGYSDVDRTTSAGCAVPGKACPCPADTTFNYDDGWGFGFNVERMLTKRFGVEARGYYARLESELFIGANGIGITEKETINYWDVSLGLNIHLFPDASLDWYAGPFVGYGGLETQKSRAVGRSLVYDADASVDWGIQTGLNIPFGKSPWALHVGTRYTWNSVDVTQRYTSSEGVTVEQKETLDVDPVTVELGVAYRF